MPRKGRVLFFCRNNSAHSPKRTPCRCDAKGYGVDAKDHGDVTKGYGVDAKGGVSYLREQRGGA
eukprot:5398851-Pyramimonas_sp.AAC.1